MGLVGTNKSKSNFTFTPHPGGMMPGTVVDIIDNGLVQKVFGGEAKTKHVFRIRFFCGQETPEGYPMYVTTKQLTLSTHPKAEARKLVEAGTGKRFTDEQEASFDYESLIGDGFNLVLVQNQVDDNTYTNINLVAPLMPGQTAPGIPDSYVREKDREPGKSKDVRAAGVKPSVIKAAAHKASFLPEAEEVAEEEAQTEYEFPHSDHDPLPWE